MDSDRVTGLKDGFCEVCKVFLVLLLQVIIYKLKMSIFKDFKTDVVINVVYRHNVDSLSLLLLTFTDLLANVCHTI